MTNEELNKIIEVRSSPELPDVDPLFWPKYDRGTWRAMHDYPVTQEFLKTLMDHIDTLHFIENIHCETNPVIVLLQIHDCYLLLFPIWKKRGI
jgi:hypothetical protein